jgi:sec-independent protein translocase protein TatC
MTAATEPEPPRDRENFHPDDYRMSIGEHLEELRKRILLGLAGFLAAALLCLPIGRELLAIICRPLVGALQAYDVNPQLFTDDATEGFMAWIQISLIAAAVLAGPWLIYQLWKFVATGLYPNERKTVTRYVPLAVVLLLSGFAFVYFIVLPLTMRFFVAFTLSIPLDLPHQNAPPGMSPTTEQTPTVVQSLSEDPPHPLPYQMWFNQSERRLKFNVGGSVRTLPFGGDSLMATHFSLGDYLDLVLRLLLTFGLCFQLPLVVMALAKIGIVDLDQLRAWRRYVYFAMTVLAAAVSPGDVVTATLALLIPLVLLYELGILLVRFGEKRSRHNAGEPTGE